MKKAFFLIFLTLLLLSLLLPVCASFENPPIVDNAGYLMKSELRELNKKLHKVREKYDFEVAIYTEDDMTSDSAEESADDIYDYQGYGAGENDDGIMLYICSDTREYHFTTHGKGIEYFNSNGLKYLESKVLNHLSENDYYEAFETYIETSEELLKMAKSGKPYNEKQYDTKYLIGVIALCLITPLLIAFWLMNKKLKKMKTAVKNNYAKNYVKPGSMNIAVSRDLFLYSRITKTEKPKSSSGTHTSSSGRTHGGRGGSF
ncbi:MAG: TPM domain-containing protein [Ruminococcaceae bacterium]|nr:TPM domain-containing protein [Oscillospiraceae bacterium]